MNPPWLRANTAELRDDAGHLLDYVTVTDSRLLRAARERVAKRNGVSVSAVQVTPVKESRS